MFIPPSAKLGQEGVSQIDLARIFKQFALIGINALRECFDLKYFEISNNDLGRLIKDTTGASYSFWDRKYKYTTLDCWKKIIEIDWADERLYKKEVFDCDNFAFLFASRVTEWFDLNGAGISLGTLRDPKTDTFLGWHAWVIFIADDKGEKKLINLETQTDKWVEIKKGRPIVIGNWKYKPVWLIFY